MQLQLRGTIRDVATNAIVGTDCRMYWERPEADPVEQAAQARIELEIGDTIARMPAADYRRLFGYSKPSNLSIAIARALRSLEH